MKIEVELKMTGLNGSYYDEFEINDPDLESIAIEKAKEIYDYDTYALQSIRLSGGFDGFSIFSKE